MFFGSLKTADRVLGFTYCNNDFLWGGTKWVSPIIKLLGKSYFVLTTIHCSPLYLQNDIKLKSINVNHYCVCDIRSASTPPQSTSEPQEAVDLK